MVSSTDQTRIPVHPAHVQEIQNDPEKVDLLVRSASSFRNWLDVWPFVDQESGEKKILGEELWEGQFQAVEAMENVDKFFALKARKLGFTTLEVAYDAYVLRFRDRNARVHLFSRRTDAAVELLDAVKYGLKRLPSWMQLPIVRDTQLEFALQAEPDDRRLAKSYPTSKETAVEATCTHAHVDEWARMEAPRQVWQAIEPSFAGSAHIITTGRGPVNYASVYWRKCMAGDTAFVPVFVSALNRPDRNEAWLEEKRRSMTEEAFRQEFPMTWEDALFAGGRFTFRGEDVTIAGMGRGPREAEPGHRYVKSWDIGRHQDAAVGVVLDATSMPSEVVNYTRLRGVPYPVLQRTIENIHNMYDGPTVIEKNGPGEAVAENLDNIRGAELVLFNTSKSSKARIIEELQVALENQRLRWSADAWPQLDAEVRGYQIPDTNIVQDSVMALAIGNSHLDAPYRAGRLRPPVSWG